MPEKKVRFDDYVLDFGRFQLTRHGQLVRLEGLPLQLLMFLIEQKGRLVTREEISSELWGKDVFVDVEQGINTAVRKVRLALEDDSDQPQYLQTVVGRGYRFIAPTSTDEDVSSAGAATGQPSVVSFEELGRAIMTAAGIDPETPKKTSKVPDEP
ncbi:MAG: winged helix-turn-helix domain-containing protein [Acidobacteriia bacterium]|nr:winged helix-turn-helix domain-containing protein [Terriglobia bacterium]